MQIPQMQLFKIWLSIFQFAFIELIRARARARAWEGSLLIAALTPTPQVSLKMKADAAPRLIPTTLSLSLSLFVHSSREHVTPEMNKLRQSLRRKKPTYVPEASRPHQWQADEEAVRKGKCNFAVRVRRISGYYIRVQP